MVVDDFFSLSFPLLKGGGRSVYLGDGFGGLSHGWHGKGGWEGQPRPSKIW